MEMNSEGFECTQAFVSVLACSAALSQLDHRLFIQALESQTVSSCVRFVCIGVQPELSDRVVSLRICASKGCRRSRHR